MKNLLYIFLVLIMATTLVCAQKTHSKFVKISYPGCAKVPVTGVEILTDSLTLNILDTFKISVQVLPLNATNNKVIWITSDSTIVSISNNGEVVAKKSGKVVVTAVTEDGTHKDSLIVIVMPVLDIVHEDSIVQDITIYPNPIHRIKQLSIKLSEKSLVTFFNEQGFLIKKESCDKEKCYLQIDDLDAGVYIIKIETTSESVIRKLVVLSN